MSYTIVTDTSANLPGGLVKENSLTVIPFLYYEDGVEHTCFDCEAFDGKRYYGAIRNGMRATTSQIVPQVYIDYMTPVLEAGNDILFVGMSSGISGAYHCSELAAEELKATFPNRKIRLIDTLSASLAEGMCVMKAIENRTSGMTLDENADMLLEYRRKILQVFTVDDLMYLRRGGRLSNMSAIVGTMLHIKPLLMGNEEGKIVSFEKNLGRRRALDSLAAKYDEYVRDAENQIVCISEADCREDAEYLKGLLMKNHPPKEIMIMCYEPVTGSHVGPGTLALFFESFDGIRTTDLTKKAVTKAMEAIDHEIKKVRGISDVSAEGTV